MRNVMLGGAVQASFVALSMQVGAWAQDDPATYCKAHPAELKCIEFLGVGSRFESRSGNVGAQQQTSNAKEATRDNSRYIVFLHVGGGAKDTGEQVARALRAQGFVVRGADDQLDAVGGPGVDYFNEQDRPGAADAADIANAALPASLPKLKPRLQKAANPPGFLGLWLYTRG